MLTWFSASVNISEEPDAGQPHVRICAGASGNRRSYCDAFCVEWEYKLRRSSCNNKTPNYLESFIPSNHIGNEAF